MSFYNAMSKKDLLLGKSRALMGGRKLTSLSDFQETPMDDALPEPVLIPEPAPAGRREEGTPEAASAQPVRTRTYDDVQLREAPSAERPALLPRREEGTPEATPAEPVQTRTYVDVQRRTKVALKLVRENFRFTEELAAALEDCAADKRLKKNTVVEIALEKHLKQEGYL